MTLLAVALVSLAAQYPKGAARFVVLDSTPPGFPERDFLERVIRAVPHEIVQAGNSNLAETMGALAEELKKRAADESAAAPETFVLIHGLQNFKKLRQEDEFSFSSGESAAVNPGRRSAKSHQRRPGARHSRHRHVRHLQQREPLPRAKDADRI